MPVTAPRPLSSRESLADASPTEGVEREFETLAFDGESVLSCDEGRRVGGMRETTMRGTATAACGGVSGAEILAIFRVPSRDVAEPLRALCYDSAGRSWQCGASIFLGLRS